MAKICNKNVRKGQKISPALPLQKDGDVGGRQSCPKPRGPWVKRSKQFPKVRQTLSLWKMPIQSRLLSWLDYRDSKGNSQNNLFLLGSDIPLSLNLNVYLGLYINIFSTKPLGGILKETLQITFTHISS